MHQTEIVKVKELNEYLSFIESCKNKSYEDELVLHKHHVIPTFIDKKAGNLNRKRVVKLSVEDHIEAHYLFSKCFTEGSEEQIGNLRAVKLLSKNSIKYQQDLLKVYELQRGENNPAKRPEVRSKISKKVREYIEANGTSKDGKSYKEIYGNRAEEERRKRAKCTRTPEQYAASAKKTAKKLKGKPSWNSTPVIFREVKYRSFKQAAEKTGISMYLIKKELKNEQSN